jgi:peptidoglycan/xylan/chitin deacetylase (PgdA/CDA1 family)
VIRGFPWARALFVASTVATAVLVVATLTGGPTPAWGIGLTIVALLAALAGGIFVQGAGLFARPILAVEPARAAGKLCLTFDDGPHPESTRAVAELLESRGHRGTFFFIGRRAEAHPELIAELVRRGHGLGNHSYQHSHATPFFAVPRLAADLERAQALFARAAGVRPRWFRAPVGILSPRVVGAARQAGLALVGWSASARDGVHTSVDAAAARLIRAARPGAILVLHDGAEQEGRAPIAAQVLAHLLDELDRRALKSVTLDELLDGVHPSDRSARV